MDVADRPAATVNPAMKARVELPRFAEDASGALLLAAPQFYVVPAVKADMIGDGSNVARESTFLHRVAVAFGMDPQEAANKSSGSGVPL
jgi:hypothetical protein